MPSKAYQLPNRKFGVELEARPVISMKRMSRLIEKANQVVRVRPDYEHTHNNFDWVVKGDHSCGLPGKYWGLEVCSPPLSGEDGLIRVRSVLHYVREFVEPRNKYLVNDSCGFHVHVDCHDFSDSDLRKLVLLYLRSEQVLFGCVASDRRLNTYCRPWGLGCWDDFTGVRDRYSIRSRYVRRFGRDQLSRDGLPSRHVGLNLAWYWSHGRVEFRMHHGTWHRDEVDRWVRLCVGLVEAAKNMRSVSLIKSSTIGALFRDIGWYAGFADDYRSFYMDRMGKMAPSAGEYYVDRRERGINTPCADPVVQRVFSPVSASAPNGHPSSRVRRASREARQILRSAVEEPVVDSDAPVQYTVRQSTTHTSDSDAWAIAGATSGATSTVVNWFRSGETSANFSPEAINRMAEEINTLYMATGPFTEVTPLDEGEANDVSSGD